MLDPEVRFGDFEPEDWPRVLELGGRLLRALTTRGTNGSPAPATSDRGLVLIHDGSRVRKALSTQQGRLDPRTLPWPLDLAHVAAENGCGWVVSLRVGALEELADQLAALACPEHDFLDQVLQTHALVRTAMLHGTIVAWPWTVADVPALPLRGQIEKQLNRAWPRGSVWLLAVTREHALWTALVVRRTAKGPFRIDLVAGPSEVRRRIGRIAPSSVLAVVDHLYGTVSFGLQADSKDLEELLDHPDRWRWALALTQGTLVLSRWPVGLGLAVVREWLIERVTRLGRLSPLVKCWRALRRGMGGPSSGSGSGS